MEAAEPTYQWDFMILYVAIVFTVGWVATTYIKHVMGYEEDDEEGE